MMTSTIQEYSINVTMSREMKNDDVDKSHQLECWLEITDDRNSIERTTVMTNITERL